MAGELRIDLARRRVTRNGEAVHLTKREFDLLQVLASNPDHVLSHQTLLRSVWGQVRGDGMTYLRVFVKQLRQKLEPNPASPRLIVTEAKLGYRLKTSDLPPRPSLPQP